MLRPGGYLRVDKGNGVIVEADTFTCVHCNGVVVVRAKAAPETLGKFCQRCGGMTCLPCAAVECRPFEKWLDRVEGREGRRQRAATREDIDTRLRLEARRRLNGLGA